MKKLAFLASALSVTMVAAAPVAAAPAAGSASAVHAAAPTLGLRQGVINRTSAPVSARDSQIAGSSVLIAVLAVAAVGAGVYVAADSDNKPVSS